MSVRAIWTDDVLWEVEQHLRFVTRVYGQLAADRLVDGLGDRVRRAAEFPRWGPRYSGSSDPDTRVVYYEHRYGIIYRVEHDAIVVLKVYDTRSPKPEMS